MRPHAGPCGFLLLGGVLFFLGPVAQAGAQPPPVDRPTATKLPAEFTVESLSGRVVWLNERLLKRRKIQTVPEAAERVLALEAADGKLWPLVEDVRGRAFRRDARLRDEPVELLVRKFPDMPFVQVIGVYGFEQGRRVEIDYWCDVCAIAMYEIKDCECCQGPIELRKRPAPK